MEHVRAGLRQIIIDILKKQPPDEAPMFAWLVVCGAEVASRTRAISFADGRLTIEVPDANWRTQLAAFTPRYISGLNDLLGTVVKEVRFQVKNF